MQNLTTAQTSDARSALVGRFSGRTAAAFILLAALWFVLCRHLSGEWSLNEQYNYGWFVPFLALYLFWLRWEDRPKAEERDPAFAKATARQADTGDPAFAKTTARQADIGGQRALAVGVAAVALLMLLPLRLFEIGNPDWRPLGWIHAAAVATLTLIYIWYCGGKPWLRHFAFPIAFFFVAVPWPSPIEEPIVQGLMRFVAAIAAEAATLFGIPAQLEGNLIRLPNGLVGVNEACSGVRSLQTALMIGLLFGELKRLSILRRIVLVGGAVAIALLANCLRAFLLVWIAATKNISEVDRWHDLAGYLIVALVFVGTLAFAGWLARNRTVVAGVSPPMNIALQPTRLPLQLPNFYFLLCALSWVVFVELSAHSWYRAHERNLVATARWEAQWPQGAENFHEIKVDETVQRILRFDQGHAAAWTWPGFATIDAALSFTAKPPTCSLFFFRWNAGKNSALLANLHRPDVCLPAVGWEQVADTGVKTYPVNATLSLPFRHFEFRHGTRDNPTQQVAHAFYCLWEDRAPASQTPQMATSASTWTRGERMRAVLEGRRHLGQQVMEFVIQTRGPLDLDQVDARFGQVLPDLIKVSNQESSPRDESVRLADRK